MTESPKVFDIEAALERLDGDQELLAELVTILFETYPESLQNLKVALETGNAMQLEFVAHSLKSALGNVGAMTGHAAAFRLEKIGNSKDLRIAASVLNELDSEVGKFRDLYSRFSHNPSSGGMGA